MMTIEQFVYSRVNPFIPLFVLFAPESEPMPFCVYSSSSGEPNRVLNGVGNLITLQMRLDVYDTDYSHMKTVVSDIIDDTSQWLGVNGVQDAWHVSSDESFVDDLQCYTTTLIVGVAYTKI